MTPQPSPSSGDSHPRVVGPLDRGHSAVAMVRLVAFREAPRDWRVDVFALRNERVKFILSRVDGLTKHYEITYDAINAGLTTMRVLRAIEDLRQENA